LKALIHPAIYRNRVNVWFLAAGMLDAARFMNLMTTDVRRTTDSSEQGRDVYDELASYISLNYRKEMQYFRVEFQNVAAAALDDYEIKKALYSVIMRLPKSRIGNVSPFWLLRKAVNQVLIESKRVQKVTSVIA
jgi:hypothetical protein